jgi:Transposase DDE domain
MNTIKRLAAFVQKMARGANLLDREAAVVEEIVHGISQTGSVMLSDIARATKSHETTLKAAEERLSETLKAEGSAVDQLPSKYLGVVSKISKTLPFVMFDPTDIAKPHGRAFENLDTVRDASDKRKVIDPGFMCIRVDAGDGLHRQLPLLAQVFSTKSAEYTDWWSTLFAAVLRVLPFVSPSATWLFDRGFDALAFMLLLQQTRVQWVIRQQQTRLVALGDGQLVDMYKLATGLNKHHRIAIPYVCKKTHKLEEWTAHFGYCPVTIPGLPGRHTLIVITGLREEDMVLLARESTHRTRDIAEFVLAYIRRWGVEEGIRMWKQMTDVENFRVRKWPSIKRLVFLSMVACGLQAMWLFTRRSLAMRLIQRVPQFIELVMYENYRLWVGTKDALIKGG